MSTKPVTIKDIAREAGVSTSLVSFVMNNSSAGRTVYRVGSDTSKRVLEVAERLNYKPNISARALRSGRTGTIGVVLSDIANPFFAEIARYLEDQAYTYDYNVIFGSSDENPEKLRRVTKVLLDKGVDGLIIVPCGGADDYIRAVIESGVNTVLLDREVPGLEVDSVVLDNRDAAKKITGILIGRGAKRIEMVSYSMDISNAREREQGYRDAMESAGLADAVHIERISHNDYGEIGAYVRSAKERGVDGFMLATNTIASLVISEVFKSGYRIPGDFQAACFDRNPLYDIYGSGIVYVKQPVDLFAERTMEIIMSRIRGEKKKKSPEVRVVLEPEIRE